MQDKEAVDRLFEIERQLKDLNAEKFKLQTQLRTRYDEVGIQCKLPMQNPLVFLGTNGKQVTICYRPHFGIKFDVPAVQQWLSLKGMSPSVDKIKATVDLSRISPVDKIRFENFISRYPDAVSYQYSIDMGLFDACQTTEERSELAVMTSLYRPAIVFKETGEKSKAGVYVWKFFEKTYIHRYKERPPRGLFANTICKKLADRLGQNVIAFMAFYFNMELEAGQKDHSLLYLSKNLTSILGRWQAERKHL